MEFKGKSSMLLQEMNYSRPLKSDHGRVYALNVGVCLAMKGMLSSNMLDISYFCCASFASHLISILSLLY